MGLSLQVLFGGGPASRQGSGGVDTRPPPSEAGPHDVRHDPHQAADGMWHRPRQLSARSPPPAAGRADPDGFARARPATRIARRAGHAARGRTCANRGDGLMGWNDHIDRTEDDLADVLRYLIEEGRLEDTQLGVA